MTIHLVGLVVLVVLIGSFTPLLSKKETREGLAVGAVLGIVVAIFFPANPGSEFMAKLLGAEIHTTTDGRLFSFVVVFFLATVLYAFLRSIGGKKSAAPTP